MTTNHWLALILIGVLGGGCSGGGTPNPTPTPTPSPSPTPSPTPTPPLCYIPPEGGLVGSDCTIGLFHDEIKKATNLLGPASPDPQANLLALSLQLTSQGLCVLKGGDAIFILREDGRWDEYHAVYFGTGSGWTNSGKGKYIGCHIYDGPTPTPSPTPSPTPTPTPSPTPPPTSSLLHIEGTEFVRADGEKVEFFGAIPCCQPLVLNGERVDVGWPVAIHPNWRNYVHGVVGERVVFFHARLGPYFGEETAEYWRAVGGPFNLVGNKADLLSYNPTYWDKVGEFVADTCSAGDYVEIDIVDRWWAKQVDRRNPMQPAWNIQSYPWNSHVGLVPILAGSIEDRWLEQVVKTLGRYPCVLWEDGNEVGLGGYANSYTYSMYERVRYWEQVVGGGLVHIFSTNSGRDSEEGYPEYVERHQERPITAPLGGAGGKPSLVNEYNPSPPYTPQQMLTYYCQAKKAGTYWWYWRHEQSMEQMEETLRLFAQPCPPNPGCGLPLPPSSGKFNLKWHNPWADATWQVGPDPSYCASIGYTDGRAFCPTRSECSGDCEWTDRAACEFYALGGVPTWKSDGNIWIKDDNVFMAQCSECTWIEVCDANGERCRRLAK